MAKHTKLVMTLGASSLTLAGVLAPLGITFNNTQIQSLLPLSVSSGSADAQIMQYNPPSGARPQRTAGSGARGCTNSIPLALNLLTPKDHIARTTLSHPTFLWHISQATSVPMVFTLTAPGAKQSIFQKRLKADQAGIVQLELPKESAGLALHQEYRWTVALVCNEKRPSENITARAWIERVGSTPELANKLASATSETNRALAYTHAGIWYDGVSLLNQIRVSNPGQKQVVDSFISLLNQVGLNKLSTF